MPRRTPGRRLAVALLAAPVALRAFPAGAQPAPTARAFLEAIYQPYLRPGYDGRPLEPPAALFTPALAQAIERDWQTSKQRNEAPLLNGDPFVDAQEFAITDLAIAVQETADRASATVDFRNAGRPIRVRLELLRTPAGWRIDDISGPQHSLRGLYKLP